MFAFECGVLSRRAVLSSPKAGQPGVASQDKWAAGALADGCLAQLEFAITRDSGVSAEMALPFFSTVYKFKIRKRGHSELPCTVREQTVAN